MDWQDLINQTLLINKTHGREGLFMSQAFKTRWRVRYSPNFFFQDAEGFARKIMANFFRDDTSVLAKSRIKI
jgi:hypothetical protein